MRIGAPPFGAHDQPGTAQLSNRLRRRRVDAVSEPHISDPVAAAERPFELLRRDSEQVLELVGELCRLVDECGIARDGEQLQIQGERVPIAVVDVSPGSANRPAPALSFVGLAAVALVVRDLDRPESGGKEEEEDPADQKPGPDSESCPLVRHSTSANTVSRQKNSPRLSASAVRREDGRCVCPRLMPRRMLASNIACQHLH